MLITRNQLRRESGQAMMFAVVAIAIAAAIGLVAITAVGRSLSTEGRIRRQSIVDTLAISGSEEVFGRLAQSVNELSVVTAHPGYDTGSDVDSEVWVRFAADGQVVDCTKASEACFTVRLDAHPRDLSLATSAVIQVTARQCRGDNANSSSCVFARRQTTLRKRLFTDYVLWVNSATNTKFVTGDVIAGPVRLNAAGGLQYCGAPVVGIDTAPNPDTQYRVEFVGGTVTTKAVGCSDEVPVPVPDMSDEFYGGADATLTLPVVSADDYAAIAGGMPAAAAATIVLNGSGTAYTINTVSTPLPLNGVIVVNGPLVLSSAAPFSGNLTVVATGNVTITSDLLLSSRVSDMLGVVSTGGNINIEFTGTSRTIEALLFAPSLGATGIVQATNVSDCSEEEETCITSTLNIYGAIVARELGAMADVNTESGVILRGFSQLFSYDERFARSQPPYALSQTRGVWMRLGMSTVSPLTPGVFGIAPPTTTTVAPAACADGGACEVGETGPGGGIVVYVSATNFTSTGSACNTTCKYIEAAPTGWGNGITVADGETPGTSTVDPELTWCSNRTSALGTTATAIGTGMANTTTADGTCTSGAIQIAADYTNNGKTDWHLPSKDELNELCKYAKNQPPGTTATVCAGTGDLRSGFSSADYWSSSEFNATAVWGQAFYTVPGSNQYLGTKDINNVAVRPVRAFGGT
jgi:hypothetical protein